MLKQLLRLCWQFNVDYCIFYSYCSIEKIALTVVEKKLLVLLVCVLLQYVTHEVTVLLTDGHSLLYLFYAMKGYYY